MAVRISLLFPPRRNPAEAAPRTARNGDDASRFFGGETAEPTDIITRHSPAIRWLGASILFGAVGAVLLAAALYVTEGQSIIVERAEPAARSARDTAQSGEAARKGDKLVEDKMVVATTKSFRAPLTERVGDREITRMQPFVRISADLPLATEGFATADIPRFDPIRAFTGASADATPEDTADVTEADVTMVKTDLGPLAFDPQSHALSDDDVAAQIRETLRLSPETAQLPASFSPQRMLSRTLRGVNAFDEADAKAAELDASFHSIAVRIVPENVTNLVKNQGPSDPSLPQNRDLILAKDQTLEAALQAAGAEPERVGAIKAVLSKWARTQLAAGQHVRLLLAPENGKPAIERVTLFDESGIEEVVAADDLGHFVSVALPDRKSGAAAGRKTDAEADEADDSSPGISVYESLYSTALKNGAPRELVEELVRVYAFTVDFQHRVEPGDHIGLIFKNDDGKPELLYASLKIDGEVHRVYRYQSPATGDADYFDEDGHSLRKFLLRKPIAEGRMSSPFGMRFHPILGYSRLHNGVDWAAPRGTPIVAAGDGIVKAAGMHGGYGNRVELSHAYGYATAYNHMASIAKSIAPGMHVHLGQVIGYLGTTGLSTGPHIHYEVTINGHFVDPMKIRLPSGQELSGAALAAFKQREQQIDELRRLAGSPTVAART